MAGEFYLSNELFNIRENLKMILKLMKVKFAHLF